MVRVHGNHPCVVVHPELQSEEPFVVRLLFEPSGRPDSQQDYYLTAKENLCVVCGKAESYIRWSVRVVLGSGVTMLMAPTHTHTH